MSVPTLSTRRRHLLDAARSVVAGQGIRGLTHRAVDRAADLPEGTCSSYFRTRRALQSALAHYVVDDLTADVAALSTDLAAHPGDPHRAADRTSRLFLRWLRELDHLQALLELTLEATRDPELAAVIVTWQHQLIGVVDQALCEAGRQHTQARAETLVGALYGVLLGGLLRDQATRPAYLEQSLTLLFDGLGETPSG